MKWPSQRKTPLPAGAGQWTAIVEKAKQLHRDGDLEAAEALYQRVLKADVNHVDALHFLGVLRQQQNRPRDARALIEKALAIQPGYTDAINNLGNIHKLAGQLDEAQSCYERVLLRVADYPDALNNLALVHEARGNLAEARKIHLALLEDHPDVPGVCFLGAMFLWRNAESLTDLESAAGNFAKVIVGDPKNLGARQQLGALLYLLERREEAAAVYRDWLALDPQDPIARHLLAASLGEGAPARADDAYIRKEFDKFADSFDEQLVGKLAYVAPQRLVDALAPWLADTRRNLDILDAGCGTGLCGPLFRGRASRLVGVDLSGRMIERAASRGYDQLEVAELTAYMKKAPAAWDLIVSADTLIYFGDLNEVLAVAARALKPGGLLGFTLEALDDDEDRARIALSGRYRHSRAHIQNALVAAGCTPLAISPDSLRREAGKPVLGWVVTARRGT